MDKKEALELHAEHRALSTINEGLMLAVAGDFLRDDEDRELRLAVWDATARASDRLYEAVMAL